MSTKNSRIKIKTHQLLVEGKDDCYVISNLCQERNLPEIFSVIIADENEKKEGGIEIVLDILPRKLKEQNLQILGIMVDADQNLAARWQAISNKLKESGYQNIPKFPPPEGWIDTQPELPKIGVWLMPNNQLPGMLEDFVKYLIPDGDLLLPKAEFILQEIEKKGLNCYSPEYAHAKALIHTWLAWQKKPGKPMGQSITARVLQSDTAIASQFVDWLNRLFQTEENY